MKILLVEDSATLRHAMSHFVRTAGHEPVIAKSGEEALQIIEQTAVDLIIMDVEILRARWLRNNSPYSRMAWRSLDTDHFRDRYERR